MGGFLLCRLFWSGGIMKIAVCLCLCVVGSLGSIIPNVEFSQGKQAAAVGVAKKASGQIQKGASDSSGLWDASSQSKHAGSDDIARQDQGKTSALHNNWQGDQLKGFNRDNAASLNDHGYAADANSGNEGANAKSSNWANADAAKSAG